MYRVTDPNGLWIGNQKSNNTGDLISEEYYKYALEQNPDAKHSVERVSKATVDKEAKAAHHAEESKE